MKMLSRLLGTVLLILSCATVTMADPISIALPDPSDGEGRYAFTWSGVIQGSPYAKYNGEKFTLSGFYFSNGTFDFTRIEVFLPPPEEGGPGSLVALPNPLGCGTGCLALPDPRDGGPGSIISLIPRIEITAPTLVGPPTARFLSLDFDDTPTTVETYSFNAVPVPEPSTILLFAAGLAGLTAIGRRRKA